MATPCYEKQMVTWLQRQEAVDSFQRYLLWRILGDAALSTTPTRSSSTAATRSTLHYAKTAPLPHLPVHVLQHHFHAVDIVPAFNSFVRQHGHSSTLINQHAAFDVYKQVKINIPSWKGITKPFTDRIRCTPALVPHILPNLGQRAFFDTVLAISPRGSRFALRVARVRTIFKYPEYITRFESQPLLAYVEWFSEFKNPRGGARMYEVSKLKGLDGRPQSAVIFARNIVRSCHLTPLWDDDLETAMDFVLDTFDGFRVNDFIDPHAYVSL